MNDQTIEIEAGEISFTMLESEMTEIIREIARNDFEQEQGELS